MARTIARQDIVWTAGEHGWTEQTHGITDVVLTRGIATLTVRFTARGTVQAASVDYGDGPIEITGTGKRERITDILATVPEPETAAEASDDVPATVTLTRYVTRYTDEDITGGYSSSDVTESAWTYQRSDYAPGMLVRDLYGTLDGCEPSESRWSARTWYSTPDVDVDYGTGDVYTTSYHLDGLTEDESRELFAYVTDQAVCLDVPTPVRREARTLSVRGRWNRRRRAA